MVDDHEKHKEVFEIFQNEKESRERTDATGDDADQRREHTHQHVIDDGSIDRGLANEGEVAIDDRLDEPTEPDDHEQEIIHAQREVPHTYASPIYSSDRDFRREQH